MNKTATLLVELLRAVPLQNRIIYDTGANESTSVCVGALCHAAASEIEKLQCALDAVETLEAPEDDPNMWAELYRLREAVKGPDGFATWRDAAVAERVKRVTAEYALQCARAQAAEPEGLDKKLRDAQALADSEGTRAVNYLRRARKAEAALKIAARLMPAFEAGLKSLAFTADKAGEVYTDLGLLRESLAAAPKVRRAET